MPKKVLIFHPHFTIAGGAGTFVLEVGKRLHDMGYKVIALCIRHEKKITEEFSDKICFIELGGPLSSSLLHWLNLPFFLVRAFRISRAINAEIIFPQVFPANWWAFCFSVINREKDKKQKIIWMCQEPSAFIHSEKWINAISVPYMKFIVKTLNPLLKTLDIYLAKQADFVFANSAYGASYAQKVYNYAADKLSYIYLGADSDFELGNKAPEFEQRFNQIVTVCRLTKFKNVDFLIDIAWHLKAEKIKLKVVGIGEELVSLKKHVAEKGLTEEVEFCGALSKNDLIRVLSDSKAFALASVDEPFGLSIVEALACGTPAVVFDSGGPAEIVEHNKNGFQIPAKDKELFADAIRRLCFDKNTFQSFSEHAKIRARDFNWDNTAQTIAGKFEEE